MPDPINWSIALPYYLIALGFGYLLGSIPFGLIVTRLAGAPDLRSVGSGNIGATNVLRTGRKGLAAATLIGDILKGTVAVSVMYQLWGNDHSIIAGFGAFLGHLFPVWLKFRGGKGVATYIGVLIGLSWPSALAFAAIWAATAALTRYSSMSALLASAATPAVLWALDERQVAEVFFVMTLMIFLMHRANIARLLTGRESKIGVDR